MSISSNERYVQCKCVLVSCLLGVWKQHLFCVVKLGNIHLSYTSSAHSSIMTAQQMYHPSRKIYFHVYLKHGMTKNLLTDAAFFQLSINIKIIYSNHLLLACLDYVYCNSLTNNSHLYIQGSHPQVVSFHSCYHHT